MGILRGFGFAFDATSGACRHWYQGSDGIQRWADNDQPVTPPSAPETTLSEKEKG